MYPVAQCTVAEPQCLFASVTSKYIPVGTAALHTILLSLYHTVGYNASDGQCCDRKSEPLFK